MSVKLLTEHRLEFLMLKGDYTGSSESTLVKMPYCWKSHVGSNVICTGCPFQTHPLSITNVVSIVSESSELRKIYIHVNVLLLL